MCHLTIEKYSELITGEPIALITHVASPAQYFEDTLHDIVDMKRGLFRAVFPLLAGLDLL